MTDQISGPEMTGPGDKFCRFFRPIHYPVAHVWAACVVVAAVIRRQRKRSWLRAAVTVADYEARSSVRI